VGISGGQITALGRLTNCQALHTIDARDGIVCPGFVDVHSHADLSLMAGRWVEGRLLQGITTEVLGQDGLSYAPTSEAHLPAWRRYLAGLNGDFPELDWQWRSVGDLLGRLQNRPANAVYLIPHGAVRVQAMGWEARPAAPAELRAMQDLVRQGLAQGAAGFSTGLTYFPCAAASTAEMVALCQPVAEAGGVYVTHLRSYGGELLAALDEAIEIGRRSGVAVLVSHLRMADPSTWGLAEAVLNRIDRARASGVDTSFDIYPYTVGCAPLFALLPPWAQSGGPDAILARLSDPPECARVVQEMASWSIDCRASHGTSGVDWSAYRLSNAPPVPCGDWDGVALVEAAARLETDVPNFIVRLLLETELNATIVADGGNEADNDLMFAHPAGMVGSDGVLVGEHPHPRGFGTYPRVLAHYVRQKKLLSWEAAVHKMSGMPAARLDLQDRGVLRVGAAADIVVLDPGRVADGATFDQGRRLPRGVEWVLVNGHIVVKGGKYLGGNSGQSLTPLCK
jgi:N-acyl-D-amino-acid deacylase